MEVLEPAEFSNNASARRNSDFVTSEISELLSSGRIREVSCDDVHTINSLSVADNGDKLRLILPVNRPNFGPVLIDFVNLSKNAVSRFLESS